MTAIMPAPEQRTTPNKDWRLQRRNEILRQLKAFYQRTGRVPTTRELGGSREERVRDLPGYGTIVHHFGAIANALREIGLTPRTQGDRLNPDTRRVKRKRCPHCRQFVAASRHCDCRREKSSPRPAPKRITAWRADFLRILPEARAELARQDSQPVAYYVPPRRSPLDD